MLKKKMKKNYLKTMLFLLGMLFVNFGFSKTNVLESNTPKLTVVLNSKKKSKEPKKAASVIEKTTAKDTQTTIASNKKMSWTLADTCATCDFDGDGIPNNVDIDDDNDGVLDEIENNCATRAVSKTGVTVSKPATIGYTMGTSGLAALVDGLDLGAPAIYGPGGTLNGEWFRVTFPSAVALTSWEISPRISRRTVFSTTSTYKVQGSNDATTWTDLTGTLTYSNTQSGLGPYTTSNVASFPNNTTAYKYYRYVGISATAGDDWATEFYFTEKYCTNPDTDGDGFLNQFDLDSDNDGCSDAREALATTTTTTNYSFTGAVGTNGLVNTLETSTDNGVLNYTNWYAVYAISNKLNLCMDTDGDTVPDLTDIDDDNDGVLDNLECSSLYPPASLNSTYPSSATTNSVIGATIPYGQIRVRQYKANRISTNTPFDAYKGWPYKSDLPSNNDFNIFDVNVSTYFTDTFIPTPASDVNYQDFGFEYLFWLEAGTYTVCLQWDDSYSLAYSTTGNFQDMILIKRLSYAVDGTFYSTFTFTLPQRALMEFRALDINGIRQPSDIFGFVDSNGVCQGGAKLTDVLNANTTVACDDDGDGIPNIRDLDSDGDGCPDAKEAGVTGTLLAGNVINGVPNTTTSIANAIAQGIYGANGLANALENNDTASATTSYTNTYAINAISATKNGCADYDNDGVTNVLDIDMDNDGVLNATESAACFYTSAEAATIKSISSQLTISGYPTNNVLKTLDASNTTYNAFNVGQDWVGKELYNITATNAVAITGITLDLYTSGGSYWVISPTASDKYKLQGSLDTNIWVDLSPAISSTTPTTPVIVNNTLQPNTAYKYYRLIGVTGTCGYAYIAKISLNAASSYNPSLNPKPTCSSDTDGDGIYNYLDLDSDNDGCSDAYEAGVTALAGVTMTTNNSVVAAPYGTNGFANSVETSADSGVYKGTYTYANATSNTVHTCPCPTISGSVVNTTSCGASDGKIVLCGLIPYKGGNTVTYIKDGGSTTTVNNLTCDASGCIKITGLTAGSYTSIKVITLSCAGTTPVSLTISETGTTAGTITSNQTICKDTMPSALSLTGNTGSVVKWQKATDAAFTTPVDIADTSTTLTGATIGNLSETTYFRAVVKNGSCSTQYSNVITITVPSSTWNGSAWSNGVPTIETTVIFTGNYSSSSDLFACSVTVTNGANVVINSGNDYTVYGKVTVDTGSVFEFKNDANLIQITGVQNSGNIIARRNTIALSRLDYKLWSSPVTPQQMLAFTPQTLTDRFYIYNSAIANYSSVAATSNFDLGKGYLIRMPNTFPTYPATQIFNGTFTGVPNNGDINVAISNSGDKFSSIGNPYPSTINPMNFVTTNSDKITGTLYIWRKRNNTNYLPGYITWAGGTMTGNGEPGTFSGGLDYIQIGQGFLVESKNGASSVLFNNTMRSGNNGGTSFKNANTIDYNRIWLNLTSTTTTEFNQMAVGYITGATLDVDLFDGKNINNTSVLLCSLLNNENYTIQGRPLPFTDTDVVPLLYKVTTSGNYTIAIDHVDGLFAGGSQDIFIKDNLNNTYNNLNMGAYTFASDAGTFNNRFELVYRSSALGTHTNTFTSNQVVVYKNNDDIVINTGNVTMAKVKIFDIRGRLLAEKQNINATETKMNAGLTNEVLLVQITSVDGTTVVKKTIN